MRRVKRPPLPSVPPAVFYEAGETGLAGPPGSLIDALELEAPPGIRVWAVLYRSTGLDGTPVPVSGLVLAPAGESPGERSVVAWAHGTTGIADACAPSLAGANGGDVTALADLVRGGLVLVATDYEGLGTAGVHPYLVGVSEGRSLLDAIRAAGALPETSAGRRSIVLGISQGGHAALWAGEIAEAYAPELDVAGVVAASPPVDLRALQHTVLAEGGHDLAWLESLMVAAAWSEVYGLPLDDFLTPEGRELAAALTERCPWDLPTLTRLPFVVDPVTVPVWQRLLEVNSPGHHAARPPILVVAARDDEVIPASTIPPGVDRLRAAGGHVELEWVDGSHTAPMTDPAAVARIVGWMLARLAGQPESAGYP
ncbi:MAG: hypothetical protein FIA92_14860 [Chloroflexi bacterium]|nr:hypothetical protein [Chloroflexota bacterium]